MWNIHTNELIKNAHRVDFHCCLVLWHSHKRTLRSCFFILLIKNQNDCDKNLPNSNGRKEQASKSWKQWIPHHFIDYCSLLFMLFKYCQMLLKFGCIIVLGAWCEENPMNAFQCTSRRHTSHTKGQQQAIHKSNRGNTVYKIDISPRGIIMR